MQEDVVTDFLHQNCANEFPETKKNVCMATKPYRLIYPYIVHNFFEICKVVKYIEM